MRCPWAIKFITLTTRCRLKHGHTGLHEARGLVDFPSQKLSWLHGDRREFLTDRPDFHAWEEGPPP
jgi:hypothetical protein